MTWDITAGMMFFLPTRKVERGWGLWKTWRSLEARRAGLERKTHSGRQPRVTEGVDTLQSGDLELGPGFAVWHVVEFHLSHL